MNTEMTMNTATTTLSRTPIWFWGAVAFGLLWNAYGVYQFLGTFSNTTESLMATGMTAQQAEIYLALPGWTTIAFAIGVFGAMIGCILLALRKSAAVPVLATSLAGYIVLFGADTAYGVFANIPSQLAILSFVVVVAAGLLGVAVLARKREILA